MKPEVSVILPVYNGARFLREAIQSILDQTFSDFELIIINDGSTDQSEEMVLSFSDKRIRYVKNHHNMGLIATLNKGLEMASGTYIARMDCDDISLPLRFEKQVEYFRSHPEVGLIGSCFIQFNGEQRRLKKLPLTHNEIKASLLFHSVVAHPTVMWRKSISDEHHLLYELNFPNAEDFRFWCKMSDVTELANMEEPLLLYRIHDQQISIRKADEKEESVRRIQTSQLEKLQIFATEQELECHSRLSNGRGMQKKEQLQQVDQWIKKVMTANQSAKRYRAIEFENVIARLYFKTIENSGLGLHGIREMNKSALLRNKNFTWSLKIKSALKNIIGYKN